MTGIKNKDLIELLKLLPLEGIVWRWDQYLDLPLLHLRRYFPNG
jgi:hypothetical protein